MTSLEYCPCGYKKAFEQCCGRFLSGMQYAKTPEQLMRSRYSAYALGGYGDYLLQTWFPATARGLTAVELSERSHEWYKLDVLNKSQQGDNGEVEFKAYFYADNRELDAMRECSTFKRIKGCWYYVGAKVTQTVG
ncbi:MAG TPA: YchJ family metal-binding protein [Pseudomonadales bacterium]|nr:YchJ family metal-binding protein [Pseudomonadales bacterium]